MEQDGQKLRNGVASIMRQATQRWAKLLRVDQMQAHGGDFTPRVPGRAVVVQGPFLPPYTFRVILSGMEPPGYRDKHGALFWDEVESKVLEGLSAIASRYHGDPPLKRNNWIQITLPVLRIKEKDMSKDLHDEMVQLESRISEAAVKYKNKNELSFDLGNFIAGQAKSFLVRAGFRGQLVTKIGQELENFADKLADMVTPAEFGESRRHSAVQEDQEMTVKQLTDLIRVTSDLIAKTRDPGVKAALVKGKQEFMQSLSKLREKPNSGAFTEDGRLSSELKPLRDRVKDQLDRISYLADMYNGTQKSSVIPRFKQEMSKLEQAITQMVSV